jgi:3',5'-cyclic AMP phosphodiesterase CpdA
MLKHVQGSDGGSLTRRGLLLSSLIGGAALRIGAGEIEPRPLRIAHLTDLHVCQGVGATSGVAAALESVNRLRPAVDFILTGGDHVMDAFGADAPAAALQWNLYRTTMEAHCRLPVHSIIGNHDVFAWGRRVSPEGLISGYGKAMAMDRLSLRSPYYSFDRGAWHFVCLDNVARRGNSYYGALDPEQTEWLKADLRSVGRTRPICIVTHIPILSACVFFDPDSDKPDGYGVRDSDMHHDVRSLMSILKPDDGAYDVKLALSGHIHLLDRVEYRGITFICGGAVSGNWWKGAYQGCEPGYGLFDLWPDGRFEHRYVKYASEAAAMTASSL